MKKYVSIFILAFFLPVCSSNVFAGLKVLEGEHMVVYDIVNPRGVAFIPEYSNESFDQKVVNLDEYSKRVTITSKMGPLKSRVPFPVPTQRLSADVSRYLMPEQDRQSQDPAIVRLAGEITREAGMLMKRQMRSSPG